MDYPEVNHLYKYCAYNTNSLSILINKKIWVAKPDSFNDPFDCNIKINPKDFDVEAFKKYLYMTGRITKKLPWKNCIKPFEEFLKKDVKNFGVFSMSQINDNILMWSHYADQHKGFCIEFDRLPNNLLGDFEITQPVNYSCDYPKLVFFDSSGKQDLSIFKKTLFYKAKDWAYEKEWRLIYDEGDREETMPANISSIIFGLRMSIEHKRAIQDILADRPDIIRYKQAIEAEYQFLIKNCRFVKKLKFIVILEKN